MTGREWDVDTAGGPSFDSLGSDSPEKTNGGTGIALSCFVLYSFCCIASVISELEVKITHLYLVLFPLELFQQSFVSFALVLEFTMYL